MTFERIKYFYDAGLWNAAMVKVAVKKGIITSAQYTELTGLEYGSNGSNASIIEEKAAAYDILTGGLV